MTVRKTRRGPLWRYEGKGVVVDRDPRTGALAVVKNLWGVTLPAAADEAALLDRLDAEFEEEAPEQRAPPDDGLCADASVEGSGFGRGEIRVTTAQGALLHHERVGRCSANFAELTAIRRALDLARARGERRVWTDSEVARTWLRVGPTAKVAQREELLALLCDLWTHWPRGVQVLKWWTRVWGEIPADFQRKGGRRGVPPLVEGERSELRDGSEFQVPGGELPDLGTETRHSELAAGNRRSATRHAAARYRLVAVRRATPGEERRADPPPADEAAEPPEELVCASVRELETALDAWARAGWALVCVQRDEQGRAWHYLRRD